MQSKLDAITPDTVRRAVDGDKAALEDVVRGLERPFYNLALRMALSPEHAEDATQECLIRVATRLAQFDGRSKFSTWAWRVAVRRILDLRESLLRPPGLTFEQVGADLADGLDLAAPERADDLIELGELKVRCGHALLQCLDGDLRIAFVVGEILDFDGPEAAEILELEPATFRKRLSRARERIREVLTSHCGVFNPEASCRCHRRLAHARLLGRVAPGRTTLEQPVDVRVLRERLGSIDVALRAAEYYRADPSSLPRRDLVRAALEPLSMSGGCT